MAKIKTSIPQMDELLNGGLEKNTVTILWVKPGLDGSPFAYQVASNASKSHDVVYVINSKNPEGIKKEMKSYGFKTNKIKFVDAYSGLIGEKPKAKLKVQDPKNEKQLIDTISKICKNSKNPFLVLDSLSNALDLTEDGKGTVLDSLKKIKATQLLLFTNWEYASDLINKVKKTADNIVNITSLERKLFIRNYFGVTKSKARVGKQQAIPYKLTKPGGIKIYIPKVLVTGPFNSGKTSFIHSASEKAVSVDRLGTTIALDHGHVKYKDFAVDLFGTPGQQRFDPILKLLGGEALGAIIMVSATDPSTFPRALDMITKANIYNLPYVVAANKSNLKGALQPTQIKNVLGLKDLEVIPVVAKDLTRVQPGLPCELRREDIEKVLDALFSKLLKGGLT